MTRHRRPARARDRSSGRSPVPGSLHERLIARSPYIRSADDALDAIHLSATDPCGNEIVVLLLDGTDRIVTSLSVTDVTDDDAVLRVSEMLGELRLEQGLTIDGVVFAQLFSHGGHLPNDCDEVRWRILAEQCRRARLRLCDWYLVCDGAATSMAEWMGAPARWAHET